MVTYSDATTNTTAPTYPDGAGVAYHSRLMQTDFDGKSTFSFVVSVNNIDNAPEILVYPNPATDHLWIQFATIGKYFTALFNSNGQLVKQYISSSGNKIELNLSDLKSGIYFLSIDHEGKHDIKKIMIKK